MAKKVDKKSLPSAVRMRKLLDELGLTQVSVADRARELGSTINRNDVNKVANGLNQARSDKIRAGIALGTGIDRMDINAYLDGKLSLDDLQRRRMSRVRSAEPDGEMCFGQLDGWAEAERDALEMAQSTGSTLTSVDFTGARLMKTFGVPAKLTSRFVTTIAWLWSQTATEDMRRTAESLLKKPPDPPSGLHKAAGRG